MRVRTRVRKAFYACGGALLVFILCFGLLPHLLERVQLTTEASKAIKVLAAHGMGPFRATPCQRKFNGVVVEGQVASVGDGDKVEAVLKNAGIEANVWIILHCNRAAIEKAIWMDETEGARPSSN